MASFYPGRLPYCGSPPVPEVVWTRWNLDPVLLLFLFVILAFYLFGADKLARVGRVTTPWRRCAFITGWIIGSGALISPLCPLSVSLFSARVGQHMILSLISAPLVILGRPGPAFGTLWPPYAQWLATNKALLIARGAAGSVVAFTVAMWFWHAPGPYDATFASTFVYWTMHLSIFGSALMVWNVLLDQTPGRSVAVLAVGGVSTLQMTFLGALITMTPHMLYSPHVLTPYAWGMTQAGDQQLGGLIMWVPGCTVFLAATIFALGRTMSERSPSHALA
jgi:putative membrane protein